MPSQNFSSKGPLWIKFNKQNKSRLYENNVTTQKEKGFNSYGTEDFDIETFAFSLMQ